MNRCYLNSIIKEFSKNPIKLFSKLTANSLKCFIENIFDNYFQFRFLNSLLRIEESEYFAYLYDLKKHNPDFKKIGKQYYSVRKSKPKYQAWHKVIYLLVRAAKPKIMIETGVFEGFSSIFILMAMKDNGIGTLISIDKPPIKPVKDSTSMMFFTHLPKGLDSGWIIPEDLKNRWVMINGNTKEILPEVLKKYKKIDIFLHDSLHTYEHMFWEFKSAWNYIRTNGLLLSDDIYFNRAFENFARKISRKYSKVYGFGGIKK